VATRVAEGWTLSYDADGNLIRRHNEETEYRFYYNAAGRMEWAEQDGEEVARFAYDALGRRIEKDTPEKTVTYRWDGEQLLSEQVEWKQTTEGESKVKSTEREYVFSGFEPLATLSEEDLIFETDQVDAPRIAVNRGGELVWESDFSGYGEKQEELGTEEIEIRYPGQIYDEETRLSYNRFRYYDPRIRCYTQPDPIGLDGGLRLHGYVKDPTRRIDPSGLKPCDSGDDAPRMHQQAKEKGYPGIKVTEKGNPDFSESDYLYPAGPDQENIVEIELTGNRYFDKKKANKKANIDPPSRSPEGYTWHHLDDYDPDTGTATMQLVDQNAHEATYPHKGAAGQYSDYHGVDYD
jgi:RHS repeat-associated protein